MFISLYLQVQFAIVTVYRDVIYKCVTIMYTVYDIQYSYNYYKWAQWGAIHRELIYVYYYSVGFKGAINLNYIMSFMCYIVYLVYFQYSGVYFPKPVPSLSWLPLIVFRFALPICFSRFALFPICSFPILYVTRVYIYTMRT